MAEDPSRTRHGSRDAVTNKTDEQAEGSGHFSSVVSKVPSTSVVAGEHSGKSIDKNIRPRLQEAPKNPHISLLDLNDGHLAALEDKVATDDGDPSRIGLREIAPKGKGDNGLMKSLTKNRNRLLFQTLSAMPPDYKPHLEEVWEPSAKTSKAIDYLLARPEYLTPIDEWLRKDGIFDAFEPDERRSQRLRLRIKQYRHYLRALDRDGRGKIRDPSLIQYAAHQFFDAIVKLRSSKRRSVMPKSSEVSDSRNRSRESPDASLDGTSTQVKCDMLASPESDEEDSSHSDNEDKPNGPPLIPSYDRAKVYRDTILENKDILGLSNLTRLDVQQMPNEVLQRHYLKWDKIEFRSPVKKKRKDVEF